jgi:hypothetical protein
MNSDKDKRQAAAMNGMNDSTGSSMLSGSNSSFVGKHGQAPPMFCNEVSQINVVSYQQHVDSGSVNPNNPKERVEGKPTGNFHCVACNISCQNKFQLQQHVNEKKYKKRVTTLDLDQSLNDGTLVHALLEMNASIRKDTSASQAIIGALDGTLRCAERAASQPPPPPPHQANFSG